MFKATVLSTEQAFGRIRAQAAATKQYLTTQKAAMQQPLCPASTPLAVIQHLGQVAALMAGLAAVPGLADYARAQVNDPLYDIVAEFNAMKAAIDGARDTLIGMFPKDVNGWLLYQSLQPDGTIQVRNFTAAQLAPAVVQIDGVLATIA